MRLHRLEHATLRVHPSQLPVLYHFYHQVLGLTECLRPPFPFPGHWLAIEPDGVAIIHLAGNAPDDEPTPLALLPTGQFNHIAFSVSGLETTRTHLQQQNITWNEAQVPHTQLHQFFLFDPIGLKIELTFDLQKENLPAQA